MSDLAICEGCAQPFPATESWCPVCGTPRVASSVVQVDRGAAAATPLTAERPGSHSDSDSDSAGAGAGAAAGWVCECGWHNASNPFCGLCSKEEPAGRSGSTATGHAQGAVSLVLTMPDGLEHVVVPGVATHLGREAADAALAGALSAYDGVSRSHATLTVAGTRVTVTDHGSTNGTEVNGAPVRGHVTLAASELRTLRLGRYAVIHVRLGEGGPQ